ncbi:restriction endonuclease [Halalkalibacter kiskunsagensis]|uniref:Restriction endonuclease n=1 Tax=Halalkalibacter kiskunsagensis TaxID=1548599 RepID=A0ABV6KIT2_9BACI
MSTTLPKRKKRYRFVPTILFVLTYFLVQLYNYNLTLFGFVLASILSTIGITYLLKTSKLVSPHLSTTILNIDDISDPEFHQLLVPIFQRQGYSVNKTKLNRKSTANLILRKKGLKAIVHTKRQSNNVGSSFIQEAIACKEMYQAKKSIVVTNRHFTTAAKKVARANKVTLIDRDSLDAMLDSYLQQKRSHRFIQRVRSLFMNEEVKSDS